MKKFRFIYLLLLLIFAGVTGYSQDFNPNLIKGLQAVENGNYADGLKYFKQGALEGDKYSCGRLAALYFYGLGTDTNYDEAKKWAQKGYELGNSYAAAIAGFCKLYEKGMETPEGRKVAQPYLIYAYQADDAEFDNEELYANVGLMIAYAELDKGNEKEALKWIERTINDFPTYAPTLGLGAMLYWGLNDYEKAVKYAFIADKENNLYGTLVLGLCLAHGTGIAKDEVAGFNKIKKVATIGTPEIAMYYLGNCYYYGIGTPVNKTLAKEWYQKAANAGVPEAQEMLENFTGTSTSHSSTIH